MIWEVVVGAAEVPVEFVTSVPTAAPHCPPDLRASDREAVEGERENLEGAKAEAEDFLTKEFQLCQKQKVSYMLARKDAVTAKQTHEAEVEQLEGKHKEQQDKLSSKAQMLEEFEAKCV